MSGLATIRHGCLSRPPELQAPGPPERRTRGRKRENRKQWNQNETQDKGRGPEENRQHLVADVFDAVMLCAHSAEGGAADVCRSVKGTLVSHAAPSGNPADLRSEPTTCRCGEQHKMQFI